MRFSYQAQDSNGQLVNGVVEADSEVAAEELLWGANLTILSLRRNFRLPTLEEAIPTLFGVKRQDLAGFSRDLASLIEAGIPLLSALKMLSRQTMKRGMRRVILQIVEDLEKGQMLSQACALHPKVFPPLYVRLVQIGEEIGDLGRMLRQLTSHLEKEVALVSKVSRSLAYPVFVLFIGLVAVVILISVVLPAMSGLLHEFGARLPLATRILITVTDFIRGNVLYIVLSVAVLAIAGWRYVATSRGRRWWDGMLLRTPGIRDISLKGALSRMASTMHVLLEAGVSLTDTVDIMIQTTQNRALKDVLAGVREKVHAGQSLSQAMSSSPLFPSMMYEMIGVGEGTGTLTNSLNLLSAFYETDMDRSVAQLTGMLGPALVLLVGGLVGFIAVSVISPMYSVIQQIK